MTDKVQKILNEIQTRKLCTMDEHMAFYSKEAEADYRLLCEIEEYIKSMQEEPISEDLEEAINNYVLNVRKGYPRVMDETDRYICNAFKAGAKLQKQQLMAKAFDFTKEHNTACVLASECLRNHGWFNRERDFNDLFLHLSCVDELFVGKFCGKTKVIVIKED